MTAFPLSPSPSLASALNDGVRCATAGKSAFQRDGPAAVPIHIAGLHATLRSEARQREACDRLFQMSIVVPSRG